MDISVEFSMLGVLEVRIGGRRLILQGARQETALAALLLDAGRVVTFDHLVDAVWDNPPRTARRQIQDLVTRLRRGFEVHGVRADLLTTHRSGYLLALREDELDTLRFERYVADSRNVALNHRDTSVRLLRSALALRRGRTLAGVTSLALEPAIARWEEHILSVQEECLTIELTGDNHATSLNELSTLVEAHPLRERLVELLMVTLCQSGRRSEALESYARLRERLADALGLDPSARLQDLHREILNGGVNPAKLAVTAPAQLPLDIRGFTGRGAELKRLDASLFARQDQTRAMDIVVVSGTAGAGKTALGIHWAHRIRALYRDGQLYADLHGFTPDVRPSRPIDVLARILYVLEVPPERIPADVELATAMYRTLLAERQMLVFLDNARDADQVRPLLPGGSGNLVVITSRDRLDGLVVREAAHRVTVGALAPGDALAMLGHIVDGDRSVRERLAFLELADLCAHLPLALRVAAANLQSGDSVTAYLDRLRSDRLGALSISGDRLAGIRNTFDVSYLALPPLAKRLFRRASLLPGNDFTAEEAAIVADIPMTDTIRHVDLLSQVNLLEQRAPGRYAYHDLLRHYARERADREDYAVAF